MKFTEEHEWLRPEGDLIVVGITEHASEQLGDVVFVELPEAGATLAAGQAFGVVESVKAVSDLYSPVGGTVVAVNESLADSPEQVNTSAYGEGWLLILECADPTDVGGLLDAEAYRAYLAERDDAA